MNYTSISKIRARLISIIDLILVQFDHSQLNIYGLDDSKIQQWCYLLKDAIIQKEKIILSLDKYSSKTQNQVKFSLPKIGRKQPDLENEGIQEFNCSKLLQIQNSNKLVIYQLQETQNKLTKIITKQPKETKFQFPEGTLKRFCSVVQVSPTKFVIAGGCQFMNPSTKSANIMLMDTQIGQMKKIGEIIEPLSSHSSLYIQPKVYFIGGKKSEGVTTKMCSSFDVFNKQVQQISALNFAVSSCCVAKWKQEYIYKIGGIGQCFGEWGTSPYIQRYSIEHDTWELINPSLPQSAIHRFEAFKLFVHSMAYVTSNDQLVIFGGFDAQKKPTNFGCIIKIKTVQNGSQMSHEQFEEKSAYQQHQIIEFGVVKDLPTGGFWSQQFILCNQSNAKSKASSQKMCVLQTTMINNKPVTSLVKLSLK